MRRALTIALAGVAIGAASPAMAAITLTGTGSTQAATIDKNTAANTSFTINFNAQENGVVIPGITSSLTMTYMGFDSTKNQYLFNYLVTNNASPTTSRVTVFGFDVDPNKKNASSTGIFSTVSSGSITNQTLEVCFDSGQTHNCNNSTAGVGVWNGTSSGGTLKLGFTGAPDSITLSHFLDRYQSIGPNGGSAIGVPTAAVPEPATWAMMLLGFGGIGMTMRHRRRNTALMQIA